MYPQIRNGSVKECEVEMVGEECEVYCEDGRRRVLVLTGHAGRVAPISPMLKRRISCGLDCTSVMVHRSIDPSAPS